MKAHVFKILASKKWLPLLLLLASPAAAQVNYAVSGSTAYVTNSPSASGNIVIASTYGGYPVSSIGTLAFNGCSSLTSVTIPNSVTSIGAQAFGYCTGLTNVTMSTNVTSLGQVAFYDCTGLTSAIIPNSVTNVALGVFESCSNIASVSIGNHVTYLPDLLFGLCTSLTNVTIPTNVTSIGGDGLYAGPFYNCTSLTSITIPNSVTSVGEYAFNFCAGLTNVAIPDTVTNIGQGAFYSCLRLTSVTIPNSVASLGPYVFDSCASLTTVTIGTNLTNIGSYGFAGCSGLTGVYFQGNSPTPNNDSTVFTGDDLGVVYYLPSTMGWSNIFDFDGLPTRVPDFLGFTFTTNNGVITITGYTGSDDQVTIPDSIYGYPVTTIGTNALANTQIIGVTIPDSVTNIGQFAFYSCTNLTSVAFPSSITSIGKGVFEYCTALSSVDIPESVTNIGEAAFEFCPITSLTIPDSVISIGDAAFFGCSNLTSLTIGNGVTNIAQAAFEYCTSLASITVPASVTSIGADAFYGCASLSSATIGSGVTSIGSSAFYGCSNLAAVYFQGNSPSPNNDSTVFSGDNNGIVYHPAAATGWGAFFDGLTTMPLPTITVLHTFSGSDGSSPALAALTNNTLYGDTYNGNTVFKINTDGSGFTNIYTLVPATDGQNPGGLLLSGNTLYGTAGSGGANGQGTVFRLNLDGSGFTVIYTFSAKPSLTNSDGANPDGGLVISNNTLYGTALRGGTNGNGTVFKLNTNGTGFTVLHTFSAGTGSFPYIMNADGALPNSVLTLSGNALYGTTRSGGADADGTVFKVNTDGTGFTNVYIFSGYDGSQPGGLLLQLGNTLYGAADAGGNGNGTLFQVNTDGTGFKDLYTFADGVGTAPFVTNSDGAYPALAQLSNNIIYGKTAFGGTSGEGTVFKLNVNGSGFTTLYTFSSLSVPLTGTNYDGADPGYMILSDNVLYGAAGEGGTHGDGTVFALNLSPPPSVAISRSGNQIVISWPTNDAAYTLQSVSSLSGSWSNVTSGITIVGANYEFTPAPGGKAAFFRLVK